MDRFGTPLMNYGCAACFSPDPDRPGKPLLPFEVSTGRLVDEVWERWLELDPVRMAPGHADALRSMRRIYLDAGRSDEWYLDLGAQAFAGELEKLGADHTLELFDGKHGGLGYRYPAAIRELVLALSDLARPRWMPIRSGSPAIARVSGPGRRPSSSNRSRRRTAARTIMPPA